VEAAIVGPADVALQYCANLARNQLLVTKEPVPRLAGCEVRPELHRHQIAALHATLAGAGRPDLARAAWMDRWASAAEAYRALGSRRLHQAAILAYEVAIDPGDLVARAGAAWPEVAALELAAGEDRGALVRLCSALTGAAGEDDPERRREQREAARESWRTLRRHNPGCTWRRLCEDLEHRRHLPFDAPGLAALGEWLEAAVGDDAGPDDAAGPEADPALRLRLADGLASFGTFRGARPSAALTARAPADEDEDSCEPARAAVLEVARAGLARASALCQPHLERHHRELIAAALAARTATEIEHEARWRGERMAVESAWLEIFFAAATRAVAEVMTFEIDRSESRRRSVAGAQRAVTRLLGTDFAATLAIPRVWSFFREVVFHRGQIARPEGDEPGGVALGEVGMSLIPLARQGAAWHHAVAPNASRPRFAAPEALRDHLVDLYEEAAAAGPRPAAEPGRTLLLWGRLIAPAEIDPILAAPARANPWETRRT
jgi:hypothetical protein